MPRPRPSLPLLAIPAVEEWLDSFDSNEQVEYSLNLGAESPGGTTEDDTPPSLPLQRKFTRRPKPTAHKQEALDRDCAICFEYAVQPARTLCCGKIFCREHITDWLSGPSSDGRCPSCSAPCSSTNILSLTPSLKPPTLSQGTRVVTTTTTTIHPSPRHRSQSESTTSSSMTTTTTSASSISPSTLSLSPALEPRENHSDQPWLTALMDMRSGSPSLSTLVHSQDEASAHARSSSTVEGLSRLVSVMGLTVLFYALLASS